MWGRGAVLNVSDIGIPYLLAVCGVSMVGMRSCLLLRIPGRSGLSIV